VYADVHIRGIGLRRLQIIAAPSFQTVSVWELRQSREWQLICPRVVETEPALLVVGYQVVPFPSSALAAYFERVVALTLPLRPDLSGLGGADGTLYEFAIFGDLNSEWRFKWWSDWPEQWRPLITLAADMHAAFATAHRQDAEQNAADRPHE
jgi:hypothetical protein